jgi:hypothetical protein
LGSGTTTRAPRRTLGAPSLLLQSAWTHRRDRRGFWFVAPFLAAFLIFMLAPLGYAVYTSLYTTRVIGGTVFSGAANYTQTVQSGEFWSGVVRGVRGQSSRRRPSNTPSSSRYSSRPTPFGSRKYMLSSTPRSGPR